MNKLQKKIGIIGGGQLGKMMILDAKRLGFYVVTLDPSENCPSHSISDEHIIARFDDREAILSLANKVDVITYEFEHIDVESLKKLEQMGHLIYPSATSLEIIQNKLTQKQALREKKIPVPAFISIDSIQSILRAGETFSYPMMLKTCTGGYDGKGNAVIVDKNHIVEAFELLGAGENSLMIEEFIPFVKEISVLACRNVSGDIIVYPVAENIHVDSILDETIVPAVISQECTKKAMTLAQTVMEIFDGVGMFCVEMFVTKEEEIYINEVAPRPHNSGHYTIEGCLTSQFEQHIRAITELPFGDVTLRNPVVMKNILGEDGENGIAEIIGFEELYKINNVKLHIYGKEEVKSKRKMGHLTVCDVTVDIARDKARKAKECIKIVARKKAF